VVARRRSEIFERMYVNESKVVALIGYVLAPEKHRPFEALATSMMNGEDVAIGRETGTAVVVTSRERRDDVHVQQTHMLFHDEAPSSRSLPTSIHGVAIK
jgi:hypothetical protein